jgi:hypothetical protein
LKKVATRPPWGVYPGPNGLSYKHVLCGFGWIQPFFKERKGLTPEDQMSQQAGQLMLMGLVMQSQ